MRSSVRHDLHLTQPTILGCIEFLIVLRRERDIEQRIGQRQRRSEFRRIGGPAERPLALRFHLQFDHCVIADLFLWHS